MDVTARWTLAPVLVLALTPGPALAGTASVSSGTPGGGQLSYSSIEAAFPPGGPSGGPAPVANDVSITFADAAYTVTDNGETVQAGAGCTQLSEHEVRCPDAGIRNVTVRVGGANDVVDVAGVPASTELVGGNGDDTLSGSDVLVPIGMQGTRTVYTHDSLIGGTGGDTLNARAGDDQLTLHELGLNAPGTADGSDTAAGGGGDDIVFAGSTNERDVLDGGTGVDRIDYAARTGALAVDLGAGVGGQTGENDALAGFENVSGGSGPNQLIGDAGANILLGGPAADRIAGAAGADWMIGADGDDILAGGDGSDRVEGGGGNDAAAGGADADLVDGGFGMDALAGDSGDDVVFAEEQGVDDVKCGDGDDRADVDVGKDVVAGDCELLRNRGATVLSTDESGAVTFTGSAAAETQVGGASDDSLSGAGGSDLLCGAGGDDLLDGGAGGDRLFGDACAGAAARTAAVTVAASSGNDVLKGGAGPDELVGGKGADRLVGGPGRDKYDAGPGRDRIDSADGLREVVRCGTGRDSARVDRRDRVRGCERVTIARSSA